MIRPSGTCLDPRAGVVVETMGAGGWYTTPDGSTGTFAASALPGPLVCAYGAGDSFAARLTFASPQAEPWKPRPISPPAAARPA